MIKTRENAQRTQNVRKETMEIQTVGNANNAEESERMRYTQ